MMVSHESLAGLLGVWGMPARAPLADRLNRQTAEMYDQIVCTTAFAFLSSGSSVGLSARFRSTSRRAAARWA